MKQYPIKCLHNEVSKILSSLPSVNFDDACKNGFDNNVLETDTTGGITVPAQIYNNKVRLSMAFCQYLWIFCKIGLLFADNDFVNEYVDAMPENEQEEFLKELEIAKKCSNLNVKGVRETLYADSVLRRADVLRTSYELVGYAKEIKDNGASDDLKDQLFKYIHDPVFSIGVNGAYTYALAFILLHEYSHFELGHNQLEGPKNDELDADFSAFWDLYAEAKNEQEARTIAIGMVCSLSVIAIYQGTWQETEEHPSITERIENLMKEVDDKPDISVKIKHIICYYILIWAFAVNDNDCPTFVEGDLDESFNTMFEYVKQH